jgi:hypothetical protein
MFKDSVWFHAAVLPLAGIHIPGESVKETIRKTVDSVLEYTRLYDVLNFLVSRQWDPNYDMNPATNSESPHMNCLACGARIYLQKNAINFQCPDCNHSHRLCDYLGTAQNAPEDWSREEAAISLRNALETPAMFYFVIKYWRAKPVALSEILFLKDGPLLLRAQLGRLVEPIRAFISRLRQDRIPLHMTGIEKNGELVDHIEEIKVHLPECGDFFVPSVRYIVEDIAGVSFDPLQYRNRVQYGSKAVVRIGKDHIVAMDVPIR